MTPLVAILRAQALEALERHDEALTGLALARNLAEAQHARPLLWRIEAAEGALYLRKRERRQARAAFDRARETAAELVADLDEPSMVSSFHATVDRLAPPPAGRTEAQVAKANFGGLTRRERDTAALLSQGKSNRAIAKGLGIGERTVEGHVASALGKLGFSSRAQLAVWAAENGIAAQARH